MSSSERRHVHGVDYEGVDKDYLQKRQLQKGAAGWVLLAGLGVAYVISGDFAGWNFGLAEGGWGGLLIATILMATMYTCMVFGLAEMASAIPVAGAGYGFARRALGPLGGFATGIGDPDRVRHRPCGDRRVHRGVRRSVGSVRTDRRLAGLPGVLPDLRGHPHVGRRRGAEGHVPDHWRRHGGAGRLRRGDDSAVRPVEALRHRADRRGRLERFIPFGFAGCWRPSSTGSGSSWPSRACRSPPRKRGTRDATCRRASSPRWSCCWCSRR